MGGTCAFRMTHVMSYGGKKCPSIMLLEAPPYSFFIGATHFDSGETVCRRWCFFIFFFYLFSLKSYRLIIFVVNISTLFLILLIFNFVLGPFVKQYLFLISLLNSNLSYVIFSNLILTILISSFFPWSIS